MSRNRLPKGKGFFIWGAKTTEGGDPQKMAAEAKRLGLGHVLLHIHDGYLGEKSVFYGADLTPFIKAFSDVGIECWGWGAVYRSTWLSGAKRVVEAFARHPELVGYIIDAEGPISFSPEESKKLCVYIRDQLPNIPIGLSSHRFPNLHGEISWDIFREYCDFDMPQVYWEQASNARSQLIESYTQFQKMKKKLPFIPTGPIYKNNGWAPTVAQIDEFLRASKELGFPAVNMWVWYQAKRDLRDVYEYFGQFDFGGEPVVPPVPGVDVTPELDAIEASVLAIREKMSG